MKPLPMLLTLLLLVPLVPATVAEPTRVLEDPADDISAAGTMTAPTKQGSLDLRYLEIRETLTAIEFTLGTQPDTGHMDQGQVFVWFRHEDAEYRLNLQQRNAVGGWYWVYVLERVEPSTGGFSFVSQSRVTEALPANPQEGWVTAMIPRTDLVDRSGAIPFVGRALEDIRAESAGYTVQHQLSDRMPDSGTAMEPYVMRLGPAQEGDVEMWSASPSRASNGEATTLIYEVTAHNKADDRHELRFGTEDVPDGWSVTFPAPSVELGADETATYPVLVQVPFRHIHGSVASVNITLSSDDGAHVGRATLSVLYHAVPQPAGHHSTVWFHSDASVDLLTPAMQASGAYVWHSLSMNAMEDFEADDQVNVPARNTNTNHYWNIVLDPALQMGLNFDLAQTGTISLPLTAATPIEGAVVSGRLAVLWQEENGGFNGVDVANLDPTQPQTIDGDVVIEATVRPTPDGDLVPYREGSTLVLYLLLDREGSWLGTGPEKPELRPGGWMQLPLNEYHDPVDDIFESLQGVSLKALGPQQRPVNAGETVVFQAQLGFAGPETEFKLRLDGKDAPAARIVGDDMVRVGDGATSTVKVAITAPEDAASGTFLDIVLVASQAGEGEAQGLLRLVAEVDDSQDHADEVVGEESRGKESPGAPVSALLGVLTCVAVIRSKRMRQER